MLARPSCFFSIANTPLVFAFAFIFTACSTLRNSPKYELGDDYYTFKMKGEQRQKAFVHVDEDTIKVLPENTSQPPIRLYPNEDYFFEKSSFDVDLVTVGFKYRPARPTLPRQITTDFNGNVYLGYRLDRFKVRYNTTPAGLLKRYHHRGISAGAFLGIGSTALTPWTTGNQMADEYSGFILSGGVAFMVAFNNLTGGLGIGWDQITDRDKNIWIYQNKPWYGLTIGLNLN